MKKRSENIDWRAVEAAARRGKQGHMRPGDMELVEEAMRVDRERYSEMKRRVDAEVVDEYRSMFRKSGDST